MANSAGFPRSDALFVFLIVQFVRSIPRELDEAALICGYLSIPPASPQGAMLAMSVVALVPVVLFFLSFQKRIVDGVATSGLKG